MGEMNNFWLIISVVITVFVGHVASADKRLSSVSDHSKKVTKFNISPKLCKGRLGEKGVCMFNFECQRNGGTVLGTCIDGFLFGACCSTQRLDVFESGNTALTSKPSQNILSGSIVSVTTPKSLTTTTISTSKPLSGIVGHIETFSLLDETTALNNKTIPTVPVNTVSIPINIFSVNIPENSSASMSALSEMNEGTTILPKPTAAPGVSLMTHSKFPSKIPTSTGAITKIKTTTPGTTPLKYTSTPLLPQTSTVSDHNPTPISSSSLSQPLSTWSYVGFSTSTQSSRPVVSTTSRPTSTLVQWIFNKLPGGEISDTEHLKYNITWEKPGLSDTLIPTAEPTVGWTTNQQNNKQTSPSTHKVTNNIPSGSFTISQKKPVSTLMDETTIAQTPPTVFHRITTKKTTNPTRQTTPAHSPSLEQTTLHSVTQASKQTTTKPQLTSSTSSASKLPGLVTWSGVKSPGITENATSFSSTVAGLVTWQDLKIVVESSTKPLYGETIENSTDTISMSTFTEKPEPQNIAQDTFLGENVGAISELPLPLDGGVSLFNQSIVGIEENVSFPSEISSSHVTDTHISQDNKVINNVGENLLPPLYVPPIFSSVFPPLPIISNNVAEPISATADTLLHEKLPDVPLSPPVSGEDENYLPILTSTNLLVPDTVPVLSNSGEIESFIKNFTLETLNMTDDIDVEEYPSIISTFPNKPVYLPPLTNSIATVVSQAPPQNVNFIPTDDVVKPILPHVTNPFLPSIQDTFVTSNDLAPIVTSTHETPQVTEVTTTTHATTTTHSTTTTTTTAAPTTTTTTAAPTTTTTTAAPATTTTVRNWDYRKDCGVRPIARDSRIVGGKRAKFGDWPWQALVRESTWLGLFSKNKCGGVLLNSRFVITAGHCQPSFLASLVVVLGEHDISGDFEPMKTVTKNVKRVIVHKDYNPATFENDLAILELEEPVDFRPHIVPICMPDDTSKFEGNSAIVTGWGRLKYGGGVPTVLQQVKVPMIENEKCQNMFEQGSHIKNILPSFLCAGYDEGELDSCEGDSGGPLMVKGNDGRWVLAGTVSHGIKCAYPNLPGVYMRMTYYKPWIKRIIGDFAGETHFERQS